MIVRVKSTMSKWLMGSGQRPWPPKENPRRPPEAAGEWIQTEISRLEIDADAEPEDASGEDVSDLVRVRQVLASVNLEDRIGIGHVEDDPSWHSNE